MELKTELDANNNRFGGKFLLVPLYVVASTKKKVKIYTMHFHISVLL